MDKGTTLLRGGVRLLSVTDGGNNAVCHHHLHHQTGQDAAAGAPLSNEFCFIISFKLSVLWVSRLGSKLLW